jgi:hypothetical protein
VNRGAGALPRLLSRPASKAVPEANVATAMVRRPHWAIYWPVVQSQHGCDIRSGRCCLAHPLGLAAVVAYIDGIGGSREGDVRAHYGVKEKQTVWDHTLFAVVNDVRP